MTHLVHERVLDLRDNQGNAYRRALVYADRQPAGTWVAWVEFVSATGDRILQTDRETTQSTLNAVAYWATGLQPTYFEGALTRALRRSEQPRARQAMTSGMVALRVRSRDHEVPCRLMATPVLVPGGRRELEDGGTLIYVRAEEPALVEMPRVYEFLAQYRTRDEALQLAEVLEKELADTGTVLEVRRTEVAIEARAITAALLG